MTTVRRFTENQTLFVTILLVLNKCVREFLTNLPLFSIIYPVAKLNKIMEAYDVFVSVKPKLKQPSKVNL